VAMTKDKMVVAFGTELSILQVRGERFGDWMDTDPGAFHQELEDWGADRDGEKSVPDHGIWVWEGVPKAVYAKGAVGPEYNYTDFREGGWRQPTPDELVAVAKGENPWPEPKVPVIDDTVIVAEISNPSDIYTIKGSRLALCYAGLLLGEGKYPLRAEDDSSVLPALAFGGNAAGFFKEEFGVDFDEHMATYYSKIADCLDTMWIGDFADRVKAEKELEEVPEEARESWFAERHDRMRSSMNDIGKYGKQLSKACRERVAESEG